MTEWMPLIAAVIALLAGVLGVTIGGVLSHRYALRQQHRVWLREQRFEAYQAFIGKLDPEEPVEDLFASDEVYRLYLLGSPEMLNLVIDMTDGNDLSDLDVPGRVKVFFAVLNQVRAEFGVLGHVHAETEQFLRSQPKAR